MKRTEQRLTYVFGRRTVPGVAALVVVSVALMTGLLVQMAHQLDREASRQAERFVKAAIERRREVMAKEVKDYAAWGEAYQHLHARSDVDWAFNQQNLGATLFTNFGYEDILVIGPDGSVTYAVVAGKLVIPPQTRLLGRGLDGLVRSARAAGTGETKPVVAMLEEDGVPLMASAGTITPGGDPTIVPTAGPSSVLVFVDALTPDRLDEIGTRGFVHGLRVPRDGADAAGGPILKVASATHTDPISLRWDPERPGHVLLLGILPWLALAIMGIATLAVLILRRALRAALLIEAKTEALAEAHRKAEHSALHDTMTQMPNRSMLHRYLSERLAGTEPAVPLALVYIDLDRFKPINDAFGHPVGDAVLKQIAARLRTVVRRYDLAARVGGDEFVLAFQDCRSEDDVELICRRLLEAAQAPITIEGTPFCVGMSIGIALAPRDGLVPEEIVRHADIAMYQAKLEGGNTFRFFSAEMNDRISARLTLEGDLRRAIDAREFVLHYQPRYETVSLRLCSVEALVRWVHPVRGLLGPDAFITLAEETGLIVPLGALLLHEACLTISAHPDIAVSVNVSAAQFRDPHFVEHVQSALRDSGLPGRRLELELTENMLLEDIDQARSMMDRLKGLGIQLSMDDFGTGYSSLGYLRRFPFDRLKIDQQFVADLRPTGEARAIVQAILGLGRALNLSVTAEGVETPEQLMLLRLDGCDEVQGFHLSRPMPEDRLTAMLQQQTTGAERIAQAS